jgi:hypothetical protein
MKHRLGRIATTLALLAVTGMSTAGTAAASPPDRFTLQVDDTFLSGTSEDCGFDILLHLEGSLSFKDFYDRDGDLSRSLTTYPGLFFTFINAATGASVTSRSPDPEHYTWNPDGSFTIEITGLVMNLAGDGQRAIQAGRFVVSVDADGNASEAEPLGRSDDYHAALCEILAP